MTESAENSNSSSRKTALRYLPSTLIEEWVENPEQNPVWGKWLSGSLMHCDVTGFTAMSEALAKAGKEGAELMAAILNRFFERMISLAGEWGGVQMKFGGDAMLLYFSGKNHSLYAAACGMEMQKAMREFHRVNVLDDVTKLQMRIGIHSGQFYSASIGQEEGLLHYLLIGKDVNETALVEPMAEPGEVVVSEATYKLLDNRCTVGPTSHNGIYKIRNVSATKGKHTNIDTSEVPVNTLLRYLMKPIAEGMTTGLDGENRRAVIVFIDLHGAAGMLDKYGEELALGEINKYMKMVFTLVTRHGGYLAASDVAEEGDKLIVLFGAPVSLDKQEASAMRFALELRDALLSSDLHLSQHIGINSGFVFAGEIGSVDRREYTVIGDSVNLSARLMTAADMNTILVSESTATRSGNVFDVKKLKPILVKGKSKPIDICRLEGIKTTGSKDEKRSEMPFMGRNAEMALLSNVAEKVIDNRAACAYISDKPGIGKSRLCEEFAEKLEAKGWLCLRGGLCQRHTEDTPFSAWRIPLRILFGLKVSDSPELCWKKLYNRIIEINPGLADFSSLVADVLLIPGKPSPVVKSMDSKTRHERRLSTIVKLLGYYSSIDPIIVLIEDVQWIDGSSCELINSILSKQSDRVLICLNSRNIEVPAHLSMKPDLEINLPELTENVSKELVKSYPEIDRDLISAIVERSSGNPLFISELIKSDALGTDVLPETVYDVIMVRLDQLTNDKKDVLRHSSVIGYTFELEILKHILENEADRRNINSILSGLENDGFLRAHAQNHIYEFDNHLAWEVVYETLLYAERRRIHCRVAEAIIDINADYIDPVAGLLTHHYEQANMQDKLIYYACIAGDHAASLFANQEAIDFYKKALHSLKENHSDNIGDLSVLNEKIADVYQATARDDDAECSYIQAYDIWCGSTKGRRVKFVKHSSEARLRKSELCHKIAISCERKSDWDESIKWIDHALDSLPNRPGSLASQICATKSGVMLRKGEYQEAVDWAKNALKRSERTKDVKSRAHARNALALSYIETGQLSEAVEYLRKATELYEELDDYQGQLTAHSNLGGCLQYFGEFDEAAKHYKVALDVSKKMDNMLWMAISSSNLAELYLIWGEIEESINYLNTVVAAYGNNLCSPAIAGFSYINLCRCSMAQKNYEEAEDYIKHAISILKGIGATGLLVEADLQFIELWLAQGKGMQALKSCKQTLKRIQELDAKLLQVKAERLLGMCLTAVGEIEEATVHIRKSVELGKKAGADLEHARSLSALARVSMEDLSGFSDLTKKYINNAIEIFERIGAKIDLDDARELLKLVV